MWYNFRSGPTKFGSLRRRTRFLAAVEPMEERALLSAYIRDFSVPIPNEIPDIARPGPDGNVWFTELAGGTSTGGTLAKITPAGQVTQVPTPVPVSDFVFGSDGNIWFGGADYIGEMTQEGVLLHDYRIPSADESRAVTVPNGLDVTLGPDGNIWYDEPYVSSDIVGRLTPSGQITEYPAQAWIIRRIRNHHRSRRQPMVRVQRECHRADHNAGHRDHFQ